MSSTAPSARYAIDARNLLQEAGLEYGDHDRPASELDASASQNGVETSPLLFIDDEPIGGQDELQRWLARNAH
jgi:glutaredoxin